MHPSLAQLFQSIHRLAPNPAAMGWRVANSLYDARIVRFLMAEIDGVFDSLAPSPDIVFETCNQLRQGVLDARKLISTLYEESIFDFIQIYICIPGIRVGASSGRLGDAYDWVVRSLNDVETGDIQQVVEPNRVESARIAAVSIGISAATPIVAKWCELAFYLARVRSTLADACDHLLPIAHNAANESRAAGEVESATHCLLSIAGWAAHFAPERSSSLVAELERDYVAGNLTSRLLAQIGIGLTTTMGVHSTRAPEAWARDVLARYRTSLIGHEEVQLLCASVSTIEEAESIRPELINAIEKHTAEMISHTSEKSALRYGGERPFDILKPLFSQLCRNARSLYINELLGAWYGVAEPRRKRGIVFIASDSDGTHWFDDHVAIKSPLSDSRDELLKRLTSCMNEFLGTTVTVAGERDVSMNVPLRPGVPSEGNAEKLHEAMRDSYGLGSDELAGATFNGNNAMLVIPHTMVPIQAALCVATGRTFPIAASMQEPAADRTVKRVVLWMGGTFTDEIEIAAVTALFNAAGIVVENVSGAARTKERFLELYGSDGPDVIWITAHCEYDHFQPHKVSIGIAPGQFVSLSELEAVKVPGQGRRLLVLNICDGATGAVLGGVLGLGLGQLIAGCHQAVISHMWPVDQRISPAFGALLACELSRFASFFDAYSNSVKSIAAGKERLIETICAMPADLSQLVDRISSREFESSNIYFYGSPVFLE